MNKILTILIIILAHPSFSIANNELKYKVGDCAAYSEFGNDDPIWEIVEIGQQQYGFRAYKGKNATSNANFKVYSENFRYFETFKAPFKRKCVKSSANDDL